MPLPTQTQQKSENLSLPANNKNRRRSHQKKIILLTPLPGKNKVRK